LIESPGDPGLSCVLGRLGVLVLRWVPRVGAKLLRVSAARRDAAWLRPVHLQLELIHQTRSA
jgi:hypothetical protein